MVGGTPYGPRQDPQADPQDPKQTRREIKDLVDTVNTMVHTNATQTRTGIRLDATPDTTQNRRRAQQWIADAGFVEVIETINPDDTTDYTLTRDDR